MKTKILTRTYLIRINSKEDEKLIDKFIHKNELAYEKFIGLKGNYNLIPSVKKVNGGE